MGRRKLLQDVKQAVRNVEPIAEVILYGSRARRDATSESDWDFLILVDGIVDTSRVDAIRYQIYEVEWQTGEVLSSIVRSRKEWNSPVYQAMPFHKNVEREGLRL